MQADIMHEKKATLVLCNKLVYWWNVMLDINPQAVLFMHNPAKPLDDKPIHLAKDIPTSLMELWKYFNNDLYPPTADCERIYTEVQIVFDEDEPTFLADLCASNLDGKVQLYLNALQASKTKTVGWLHLSYKLMWTRKNGQSGSMWRFSG